jgi:hypothetical protein
MSQIARVFKLNRNGLRISKGVAIAAAMLPSLIVMTALDLDHYWLSLFFGTLFVWLCDPGGDYGFRVREMAMVGQTMRWLRWGTPFVLVGATGFEPVTSSVSDPTSPYRPVHRNGRDREGSSESRR